MLALLGFEACGRVRNAGGQTVKTDLLDRGLMRAVPAIADNSLRRDGSTQSRRIRRSIVSEIPRGQK